MSVRATACALALALAAGACMRASGPPAPDRGVPPAADSITVALWRMDERDGARVGDAGPFRLEATAGRATLVQFGRFGMARAFQRSMDSFVFLPANPVLDLTSALTVEAWIQPRGVGRDEDTPIAGRWTEEGNQQSWLFSLGGERLQPPVVLDPSPGYHLTLFTPPAPGHLWFAYQPEVAGGPRAFVSSRAIEQDRWTHVAVTFDGEQVRFYINGQLDSQFASEGRIRATTAPLLIGNYFDPRLLNRFGGYLRPDATGDPTPYYAFQGLIDELRISNGARQNFPTIAPP